MSGKREPGLAAGPGGAGRQEPPVDGPVWIVVRSTVHLQGLPRGRIATVDATDPYIQHCLRASWLVPLPAALQPSPDPEGS